MDDLSLMTADDLVRLHNGKCAAGNRIDDPCKKSKPAVIKCIQALGGQATDAHAAAAAEEFSGSGARSEPTGRITVRTLAETLLAAASGAALTYE